MIDQAIPHDENAEQAVLSAMLMDAQAINIVLPILKPEAFYREANRRIYSAMQSLHGSGSIVDPLTLTSELGASLPAVGGKNYIAEIIDAVPTSSSILHHAGIVRRLAARRRLVEIATRLQSEALDGQEDATTLANLAQQELLELAVSPDKRGFRKIRDVMFDTLTEIEKRGEAARLGKTLGVTTGYPEIDDVTNGFRQGELVSIFGGPKCGKTAFTLAVALHNALNGEGCGFVCAEMTANSLAERCINAVGRIRTAETSKGIFSGDNWQKAVKVAGEISQTRFYVDDEAFPELGDVIARALHLKSQNPEIKLLVVDYLQLVTFRMKGRRGDEEINEICKGLKGLAKRAELTVIAPGQTNFKEVDARSVPKPMLRDIQGASGPAQTSDFLFLAHRPNMNNPMEPDMLQLELAASRRTDRFTVDLNWAGQFMRVESSRAIQFSKHTWEAA